MTDDEKLAHSLKMQFGLAPPEPSPAQVALIKQAIALIQRARIPTRSDWRAAVAAVCATVDQCKYAGIDNSDLNTLLAMALQASGGKRG